MIDFTIVTGGTEGKKNRIIGFEGKFILENIGVKMWPGIRSVVRIWGQ